MTQAAVVDETTRNNDRSKKRTISLLFENKFGSLNRILGLFTAKNYPIDGFSLGSTEVEGVLRMTIQVCCDDALAEKIAKQLNKMTDTVRVEDLTFVNLVDRELVLVKVCSKPGRRGELFQIIESFRAKVLDMNPDIVIVEVTGGPQKVEAFINLLKPFGIRELARTGSTALRREFQGLLD